MHLLLEALIIHVEKTVPELRATGNKWWPMIVTKTCKLSLQVKKLDLRAREYLNAEARKTIPTNVGVQVYKSANHIIQAECEIRLNTERTRVLPYAGQTQSVMCAPNNDRGVPNGKKISASDNVINCRERKLSNMNSVSVASARPPEFRCDRQPNRLAMAAASSNVFAGNKCAETPRSSGDVRDNFNQIAEIKPVATQRYCGELAKIAVVNFFRNPITRF